MEKVIVLSISLAEKLIGKIVPWLTVREVAGEMKVPEGAALFPPQE